MRSFVLVASICALVAAGCGGGTGEEAAPQAPASMETGQSPDASSRQPAPVIDGVSLTGERLSLGDHRGRPVLINVWSSW